jgi:hypothetical protein
MTAPTRTEALADLARILDRLRADETIPVPAACWALTFHADDGASAEAIAASLGVTGRESAEYPEEDGLPWMQITGNAGVWKVRITADAGARVLEVAR